MSQPCEGSSEVQAQEGELGIAIVAENAVLLRPYADESGMVLIYVLLDAMPVRELLPTEWMPAALPTYYTALVCALLLTIRLFFRINAKGNNKTY